MFEKRYPNIGIRSENELAKRIADSQLPPKKALALIKRVIKNFDIFWRDSKASELEKQKYVRSAVGTPLGELLKRIDKKVLRPHDYMIPGFIFGGLSGSSRGTINAALSLYGKKSKRELLKLDIKRFFEQIKEDRVSYFFHKKCSCSLRASRLLAELCCVPIGPKGSEGDYKTVARGFATSTRLAVWCNLDIFLRLFWKVKRILRGYDPKIVIFVDDIGISVTGAPQEKIDMVERAVIELLRDFDEHQSLPINQTKTERKKFGQGAEILGASLSKKGLSVGSKAKSNIRRTRNELKLADEVSERKRLKRKLRGQMQNKRRLESAKRS